MKPEHNSRIVFISHDPGGLDATYPVYELMKKMGTLCAYFSTGPAGKLLPSHNKRESDIQAILQKDIAGGELRALVTGRSWGSVFEIQMLDMVQKAMIPTCSILDYWSNYLSCFCLPDGEPVLPVYYIVMDQLAYDEAVADGVPSHLLHILGHPGLDRYVIGNDRKKPARKRALIVTQPLAPEERFSSELAYTHIIQALNDLQIPVAMKFHPKEPEAVIQRWQGCCDIVDGDLHELVSEYTIVIGISTMALLHAAMIGTRVISYQPNATGPDFCITNKLGISRRITTFEDLKRAIADDQQFAITPRQYIWADGKSAMRAAKFLNEVLPHGL